jgi:perosamine synthetase
VIVVHQAGVPADIEPIRERCAERGIAVLEDAACAIGATYRGGPAGAGARLAAWSFHPRKVITTGEGGMLTTDHAELAVRLRRLREHGMDVSAADRHAARSMVLERYLELGFNYRMTDVQAAIGLVQLGRLEEIVTRRRALAQRYHHLLAPLPGVRAVTDPPYGTTNYQSYWVVLPEEFPLGRNDLLALLHARGVSARRGIMAAHLEPVYANLDHVPLPVTEDLTERSLILPLFHEITEDEQAVVVGALFDAAEGRGAA